MFVQQALPAMGKELSQPCLQPRLYKVTARACLKQSLDAKWVCRQAGRHSRAPVRHSCWDGSPQKVPTFTLGQINTHASNSVIRTDNCILLIVFFFQLRFTRMGDGKISPQPREVCYFAD